MESRGFYRGHNEDPNLKETAMFKKIKNACQYTILAYAAVQSVMGLTELAADLIVETKHRFKK